MKKLTKFKLIAVCVMMIMLACAVLSGCGEAGTYATQKNFITIGCVCPITGVLAGYGEGTLETEEEAVKTINENGGVYIDTLERKLKIRFVAADSLSTEEGAKLAAKNLIEQEHVDMLITSSGAATAIPVASVAEAEKVPFFSVNCENSAWLASGAHEYSFNCSRDNLSILSALFDVWQEKKIDSIGLLAPLSAEAERFSEELFHFCDELDLDLTVPDYLDFSDGNFKRAVKELSDNDVKAVICYMKPEELSALWKEGSIRSLGYDMLILVQDEFLERDVKKIEPGPEIKEFYTVTSWEPVYPFTSSLTEEEGIDLEDFWNEKFLSSCSEQAGFKHASVEVAVDAVKLAMALDADSISSAAKSLNVDSILGLVDFDSNNSSILPCSVLHWNYVARTVSWKKELISHAQLKDVEFEDEME